MPLHPFKLAYALIRQPLPWMSPTTDALGAWTQRAPILLVHHNARASAGLHAQFRRAGWHALICRTGADALAVHAAVPIALIMVDYRLPDMAQVDFLQALDAAQSRRRHSTPVICIATMTEIVQQRARRVTLPVANLAEPIDLDHLRELTRDTLLKHGNWTRPPRYSPARAARVLEEHVYAR